MDITKIITPFCPVFFVLGIALGRWLMAHDMKAGWSDLPMAQAVRIQLDYLKYAALLMDEVELTKMSDALNGLTEQHILMEGR